MLPENLLDGFIFFQLLQSFPFIDRLLLDKKKAPQLRGAFGFSTLYSNLSRNHVGRTWAFFALTDLELDLLAFI
jgi:hypothetical protein